MEVSQKLKIELPYDPSIPLLGIYPKESKRTTKNVHSYVYCVTAHNIQIIEQLRCPSVYE
jgi:hypothetical protein